VNRLPVAVEHQSWSLQNAAHAARTPRLTWCLPGVGKQPAESGKNSTDSS
jgi:hypothetical protein